jgi:hypothetical protein
LLALTTGEFRGIDCIKKTWKRTATVQSDIKTEGPFYQHLHTLIDFLQKKKKKKKKGKEKEKVGGYAVFTSK